MWSWVRAPQRVHSSIVFLISFYVFSRSVVSPDPAYLKRAQRQNVATQYSYTSMEPSRRDSPVTTLSPRALRTNVHAYPRSPTVPKLPPVKRLHTIQEESLLLSTPPPKPVQPLPPLRLRGAERAKLARRTSNKKKKQRAKRLLMQKKAAIVAPVAHPPCTPLLSLTKKEVVAPFVDVSLDDDDRNDDVCSDVDVEWGDGVVSASEWADGVEDGAGGCVVC